MTLAALLVMSMVAGGVWAYFSDIQSSGNNVLLAGTLDLSPSTNGTSSSGNYTVTAGGNQVNGKVVFRKIAPGESGNMTWTLTNNGTLNGTLVISSNVTFALGSSSEIKTAAGDTGADTDGFLDEYLGVKLQRGLGNTTANAMANLTYLLGSSGSYAAFSGLQATLNSAGASMAASGGNDTIVYVLRWEVGSLFGSVNQNIIQGDGADIDITFTLNQ